MDSPTGATSASRMLGLYLRKNAIQKRRNGCQTLCEIITPVILVALFAVLYAKVGLQHYPDATYECDINTVDNAAYDFVYLSRALNATYSRLAVVGPAAVVSDFTSHVSATYPGLSGDALGPGGLGCLALSFDAVNGTGAPAYFPPLADYLLPFPDEASLEAYITGDQYGDSGHPSVYAALVWTSLPEGNGGTQEQFSGLPGKWGYKIRANASALPQDTRLATDNLMRGVSLKSLTSYMWASATLSSGGLALAVPGFVPLQTAVDKYILGRRGNANDTAVDRAADRLLFLGTWGCSRGYNGTSEGPAVASALAGVDAFLTSHSLAPQRSAVAPFPTAQYYNNSFYSFVSSTFALVFVMSFFLPAFFLIRGVVVEKEAKLREGMRMMGMQDAPMVGAWYITYATLFFLVAMCITATVKNSFFPLSDGGILFLLFWLFGCASTSLCMLLSVFFSKAKLAAVVGAVLFLASFFPYFSVNGPVVSVVLKTASSLSAPVAFGLSIDVLSGLEGNGVGATWPTVNVTTNGYSLGQGLVWLAVDTLLYGILAWYLNGVVPQEYGTPLPWWFPASRAYWEGRPLEDNESGMRGGGRLGWLLEQARPVLAQLGLADPPLPASLQGQGGRGYAEASSSSAGVSGGSGSQGVSWPGKWLDRSSSHSYEANASLLAHDSALPSLAELLSTPVEGEAIEPPGPGLRDLGKIGKCVAIRGLTKVFSTPDGPKPAVVDLGLDLYEGHISVLLGHNGAGKSTTMSMLTGLIQPTGGDAFVYGASVRTGMADVRRSLGVCPQHDVLWPDLTVEEHLQFFAGLKGVQPHALPAAVGDVIRDVGLTEKRHALAASLSGGQKRKLSVGIALIGGSKFVVLDEPTSGMDPYSRRSTWQILQNAREGRVLLLTTHFMDEADILGDRIAIMADGRVQCCGSSMFLKKRFGVGYNLAVVKREGSPSQGIVDMVTQHVPAARVLSDVGAEVVLQVPLDSSPSFPSLFASLESHASALGLLSYGISVTTLEEVFLKVAEGAGEEDHSRVEVQAGAGKDATDASTDAAGAGWVRNSSPAPSATATFLAHVRALLIKRYLFSTRDRRALFFQLLIPVAALLAGLALLNEVSMATWQSVPLGMGGYNTGLGPGANRVPYSSSGPQSDALASAIVQASGTAQGVLPGAGLGGASQVPVTGLASSYPSWDYFLTYPNGTSQDCLSFSFNPNVGLPALVVGTGNGLTTLPDAYGLSSWLLQNRNGSEGAGGPGADGTPVERGASRYGAWLLSSLNSSAADSTAYASYTVLVNTTAFHAAPAMVNLIHSGLAALLAGQAGDAPPTSIAVENAPLPFTHSQRVFVNTASSFVAVLFIVISVSFIPASFAHFVVKEREVSAKHQQLISGVSIPAYWAATYLWDMATYALPCIAAIALIVGYHTTALIGPALPATIALFVAYGAAVAPFTYVTSYVFSKHSTAQTASLILNLLCLVVLLASFVMKLIPSTCQVDADLRYLYRLLPGYALGDGLLQLTNMPYLPLTETKCGKLTQLQALQQKFGPWDMDVAGWPLLFMVLEAAGYFLLAVGVDVLLSYPSIRAAVLPDRDSALKPAVEDEDVVAEAGRVASGRADSDVIVMRKLRKVYGGDKVAVRQLSFGVPSGQVFGFLGINGAGKTSTMKMVTGDIVPTSGTATLGGYDILKEQMQVRRLLGYCPQFDALLELLTVREHLQLYARIKGVPEHMVAGVVQAKLQELDLVQYQNKLAGSLSGGNKRKLSVAIALIGAPPLVFLDEPSTGMDPVARRSMWKVISRVATEQKQCSIILTTHSMEEAEALCTRIGIMVGGRLRCLGSSQHLKSKFGQGYLAVFKLAQPTQEHCGRALEMLRPFLVAPEGAGPDAGLATYRLTVDKLGPACAALGDPSRARMVHPNGTGWALAAELQREGSIQGGAFAEWWASESLGASLHAWVTATFAGCALVERHGEFFRYRLPAQDGRPLSDVFGLLESVRPSLSIQEYSLSQVSLEMIFNTMASAQEEEKGNARGMALQATTEQVGPQESDADTPHLLGGGDGILSTMAAVVGASLPGTSSPRKGSYMPTSVGSPQGIAMTSTGYRKLQD